MSSHCLLIGDVRCLRNLGSVSFSCIRRENTHIFFHLGRSVLIVRRQNTKHIKSHIYLALKDAFRHFSNLTNSALPEGQV